jgi:hypothetical protein
VQAFHFEHHPSSSSSTKQNHFIDFSLHFTHRKSASSPRHILFLYPAYSAAAPSCSLLLLWFFGGYCRHHVSRWYHPLRDWLQPRHSRPRPRLRIRTVCQLQVSIGDSIDRRFWLRCSMHARLPHPTTSPSAILVLHSSLSFASMIGSSSRLLNFAPPIPRLPYSSRPASPSIERSDGQFYLHRASRPPAVRDHDTLNAPDAANLKNNTKTGKSISATYVLT